MRDIQSKILTLETAISSDDSVTIQKIIYDLGKERDENAQVLDEVVTRLLTILRDTVMHDSKHSGHILNFFEFEANYLSSKQKGYVVGFLNAWGDNFSHVHSMQVIAELRESNEQVSE